IPAGRLVGATPPRVPSGRQTLIVGAIFVASMMVLSTVLSEFWLFNVSMALVLGIVMLSLVLLSGFAGQISLMQLTFVGVGAVTVSRIVSDGSILGIILAGLISAAVGAVVAIP